MEAKEADHVTSKIEVVDWEDVEYGFPDQVSYGPVFAEIFEMEAKEADHVTSKVEVVEPKDVKFGFLDKAFDLLISKEQPNFTGTTIERKNTTEILKGLQIISFDRLNTWWYDNSTISIFRSIRTFPVGPTLDPDGRRKIYEIMETVAEALDSHLIRWDTEDPKELEILNFYSPEFFITKSPKENQLFPGRAVLVKKKFNGNKQIICKINYTEHLEIICKTKGGAIKQGLVEALRIEQGIGEILTSMGYSYSYHHQYGFINSDPSHLGLAMKMRIQMLIPLAQEHFIFDAMLDYYHLKKGRYKRKIRKSYKVLELESFHQFGVTEIDTANIVYDAAENLIEIQRCLEHGRCFKSILPEALKIKYEQIANAQGLRKQSLLSSEKPSEHSHNREKRHITPRTGSRCATKQDHGVQSSGNEGNGNCERNYGGKVGGRRRADRNSKREHGRRGGRRQRTDRDSEKKYCSVDEGICRTDSDPDREHSVRIEPKVKADPAFETVKRRVSRDEVAHGRHHLNEDEQHKMNSNLHAHPEKRCRARCHQQRGIAYGNVKRQQEIVQSRADDQGRYRRQK